MTVQKFFGAMLIALLCCSPATHADTRESNELVDMFAWWNEAFRTPGAFTEAAFREYYTEDTVMIINGAERMRGIPGLARHFQKMQLEADKVEIVLPFEESFRSGDKIFTYHLINARGAKDGPQERWLTMGWAQIRDGKIALINFVNYLQPAGADGKAP